MAAQTNAPFLVLAHRGYSGKYLENSIQAFEAALDLKAPAIELDVHLSQDNELVVTHDFILGRTVKAHGTVLDHSSAALSKKGVSTLQEILQLINNKLLLNIEIKSDTLTHDLSYQTMNRRLLELCIPYGIRNLVFSSFDTHALKVLRASSQEARIALLDDRPDRGPRITEAHELAAEFYNVNLKRLNRESVLELQKQNLKVLAYTCKKEEDPRLAYGLGVDGVFADNLEEALAFRG